MTVFVNFISNNYFYNLNRILLSLRKQWFWRRLAFLRSVQCAYKCKLSQYQSESVGVQYIYYKMFDSDFEDVYLHQFPKTDINFYMNANNSYLLQPWNKTTYKNKPESNHLKNRPVTKPRNLSFDQSSQKVRIMNKKKISPTMKNQITLSTLTFYLAAQNQNGLERRKSVISPKLKSRRLSHYSEDRINKSPSTNFFASQNMSNKGLTNTLRHNNLLKIKQEHQNKMKEIISKNEIINKKANVVKLNRFQRDFSFVDKQENNQKINTANIILGEQPRPLNPHDCLRKPKKPSFVGIRKVMNISVQNKYQ